MWGPCWLEPAALLFLPGWRGRPALSPLSSKRVFTSSSFACRQRALESRTTLDCSNQAHSHRLCACSPVFLSFFRPLEVLSVQSLCQLAVPLCTKATCPGYADRQELSHRVGLTSKESLDLGYTVLGSPPERDLAVYTVLGSLPERDLAVQASKRTRDSLSTPRFFLILPAST